MADKSFFLVWSPTGTNPPKYRHETFASADTEAERLAKCSGRAEFYVLEAVRKVKCVVVERTDFERDDGVPF